MEQAELILDITSLISNDNRRILREAFKDLIHIDNGKVKLYIDASKILTPASDEEIRSKVNTAIATKVDILNQSGNDILKLDVSKKQEYHFTLKQTLIGKYNTKVEWGFVSNIPNDQLVFEPQNSTTNRYSEIKDTGFTLINNNNNNNNPIEVKIYANIKNRKLEIGTATVNYTYSKTRDTNIDWNYII
jgi:hypothetical protein